MTKLNIDIIINPDERRCYSKTGKHCRFMFPRTSLGITAGYRCAVFQKNIAGDSGRLAECAAAGEAWEDGGQNPS